MNTVTDRIEQTHRPRFRISVSRYQKMIETGVLTKYDRVELIDGEIVEVAPIGRAHFCSGHFFLSGSLDELRHRLGYSLLRLVP